MSSALATALMTTAAIPRSAKGSRVGKLASSPYWAYASVPKCVMMSRLVNSPIRPETPITTILSKAVPPIVRIRLRCAVESRSVWTASAPEDVSAVSRS